MYQAPTCHLWWVWTCSFRRLPSPTLPGMSTSSTGDLLARAAAGDQPAWDALVDRFCRLVWSVLGSFMLGAAAREDVYQTVWLRLVEHLDRIKDPERLAGWLATTTRNEALRVQRQQRRVLPTEHMPLTADPTASTPEEQVADAETREIALRGFGAAVGVLPAAASAPDRRPAAGLRHGRGDARPADRLARPDQGALPGQAAHPHGGGGLTWR